MGASGPANLSIRIKPARARALAAEPGAPRMPGDPELAAQAKRRIEGIPIEPGLAAEMRAWSTRLGVASPL